jgi:hypothetical protein
MLGPPNAHLCARPIAGQGWTIAGEPTAGHGDTQTPRGLNRRRQARVWIV